MRSPLALIALATLAPLATLACERDGGAPTSSPSATVPASASPRALPAAAPVPLPAGLLPLAEAPRFRPVPSPPPLALPLACKREGRFVRTELPPHGVFAVDPRAPGRLGWALGAEGEPTLRRTASLAFDASPETPTAEPLPWFVAAETPVLARSAAGLALAAFSLPRLLGTLDRVGLARGESLELVGEGDGFHAVDLACGDVCALLSTRLAKVASPGVELRYGPAEQSVSAWRRLELGSEASARAPQPVGLSVQGTTLTAAVEDQGVVAFYRVENDAVTRTLELAAPHGTLDALAAPPLVATHGGPPGEDHCGEGPASLVLVRPGAPPLSLPLPAPAVSAALRALASGTLVVWLAPLGCKSERRVVYAAVLRPDGSLAGEVVPVGDGDAFAVATSGDRVDLWVQQGNALIGARARCGG
jgi:hypothetical protein